MPLHDHFRQPLLRSYPWEGVHHGWSFVIAQQLNGGVLPEDYHALPEVSFGPSFEIDFATVQETHFKGKDRNAATAVWAPARPKIATDVSFARLEKCEVHVYQDLDGPQLRAAIELVSPRNKDRKSSRETFAAKCAGYIQNGINVIIVDTVTTRSANLHALIFEMLEVKTRRSVWKSPTGLYAVAYRAVTTLKNPRVEAWPETLRIGKPLPIMPLWISLDQCVPVRLEESYVSTCESLRIPA